MKEKILFYLFSLLTIISLVLAELIVVVPDAGPKGTDIIGTVDTKSATIVSVTESTPDGTGYRTTNYENNLGYYCNGCGPPTIAKHDSGTGRTGGPRLLTSQPTSPATASPQPPYYDNNDYSPPTSPPCSCSSGQVDVSTNSCNSGCGLQVRTCDGCYWSAYTCDLNRRPTGTPTTETICSDNLDNDCDNEADYDGGTIKNKGDSDCSVSLNPLTVSMNNPNENDDVEVTCIANAGSLRSMKASINGVDCASSSSSGNNYRFRCNVATVTEANPSKEIRCYVDTARSYLSGSDRRTSVSVCKLLSATWSNPVARQYEDVRLNVLTTSGCNGKEVRFLVRNIGTGRNAGFAPRSANVVNGRAESSWTVEFESLNGQNPLYYFTSIID